MTENIKNTLSQFGDKADQYAKLLVEDIDMRLLHIEQGVEDKNFEEIHIAAHSLKSVMKQAGAQEICNIAHIIEHASAAENFKTCKDQLPALEKAHAEVREVLLTFLDET